MQVSQEIIDYVHENRNEIGACPVCHSNIKDRKITIFKSLIDSLYKIYCWCGEKRIHEFEMKDVRHFLDHSGYSCFNNLVRFGGIVYRPDLDGAPNAGKYGINMGRARAFFKGEYKIPVQIVIDQITNERIAATYISIHDVPELYTLLNRHGLYDYEKTVPVKVDYAKQEKMNLPAVEDLPVTHTLF